MALKKLKNRKASQQSLQTAEKMDEALGWIEVKTTGITRRQIWVTQAEPYLLDKYNPKWKKTSHFLQRLRK